MRLELYLGIAILIIFLAIVAILMLYTFIHTTTAPEISKESIFHLIGAIILSVMLVGIIDIITQIIFVQA